MIAALGGYGAATSVTRSAGVCAIPLQPAERGTTLPAANFPPFSGQTLIFIIKRQSIRGNT